MAASIAQQLTGEAFFAGLDQEFIAFLAEHARERRVEQDQLLFRHGDPAHTFYLVGDGTVLLEIPAISGPTLEVQRLSAGNVLGWSWLIPPYKWTFNARIEAEATLLEFDGSAILDRCERDPAFGYQLLKRFSALMSERLDAARSRMMEEWSAPGLP